MIKFQKYSQKEEILKPQVSFLKSYFLSPISKFNFNERLDTSEKLSHEIET